MDFIEILKAAIIGIVEGLTEWLPISSTGHMILVDEFIKLNVSQEFWEMFLVVIQLGAICAVFVLFFHKLNPFSPSKGKKGRKMTWVLWAKVIVACIPAAIVGILFDDWFTENFHNAITVAIALVVYGIAFIIVERIKARGKVTETGNTVPENSMFDRKKDTSRMASSASRTARTNSASIPGKHSPEAIEARAAIIGEESPTSALQPHLYEQEQETEKETEKEEKSAGGDVVDTVENLGFGRAFGIGAFQVLAIVPGTSRSGATILGGRILGVSREAAAEFSFFLAIPVMFGWSLLKLAKAFVIDNLVLSTTEWAVFVTGIVIAFAVSILAIKFLMSYIRKHSFEIFGWYRIVLGLIVIVFFAMTGQLFILQ